MRDFIIPGFDFDALAKLAKENPERLEALRQREINRLLSEAPEPVRTRLRGLQWRIDIERQRAETPLGACARISELMWETVLGPAGLLAQLQTLGVATQSEPPERSKATVLPFTGADVSADLDLTFED